MTAAKADTSVIISTRFSRLRAALLNTRVTRTRVGEGSWKHSGP